MLYTPPIHPLLPYTPGKTDLVTVFIVLPFPEYHKNGIIYYVLFFRLASFT